MNYSKILDELNSASLFELYRLEQAIRHSLEDPVRIKNIKDSLKVSRGKKTSGFTQAVSDYRAWMDVKFRQ